MLFRHNPDVFLRRENRMRHDAGHVKDALAVNILNGRGPVLLRDPVHLRQALGQVDRLADPPVFAGLRQLLQVIRHAAVGRVRPVKELQAAFKGEEWKEPSFDERLDLAYDYAQKLCDYETEHI